MLIILDGYAPLTNENAFIQEHWRVLRSGVRGVQVLHVCWSAPSQFATTEIPGAAARRPSLDVGHICSTLLLSRIQIVRILPHTSVKYLKARESRERSYRDLDACIHFRSPPR